MWRTGTGTRRDRAPTPGPPPLFCAPACAVRACSRSHAHGLPNSHSPIPCPSPQEADDEDAAYARALAGEARAGEAGADEDGGVGNLAAEGAEEEWGAGADGPAPSASAGGEGATAGGGWGGAYGSVASLSTGVAPPRGILKASRRCAPLRRPLLRRRWRIEARGGVPSWRPLTLPRAAARLRPRAQTPGMKRKRSEASVMLPPDDSEAGGRAPTGAEDGEDGGREARRVTSPHGTASFSAIFVF